MIHVIFATNEAFCPHAAVAMISLLDHNREEEITIHLFTIQCTQESIRKIKESLVPYHAELKFYPVTEALFANFPPTGTYSLACYLRILAPSLLPDLDKALYLDSDLVVNGSIRELWNMDLSGYAVAASWDATLSYPMVKDYIGFDYREGYINSGVLLMNLAYWRQHDTERKLVDFLNTHTVKLPDQDALNIVCHDVIKFISPKWNCHVGYFAFPPLVRPELKKQIKRLWTGAVIIHFTGPAKPWTRECVNPYKRIYLHYKKNTPWKDIPLISLSSRSKGNQIIFLRKCKNCIARLCSYTY